MQLKMGVGMKRGGTEGMKNLYGFSSSAGRELAHVTPDGRLLIWDATVPKGGSPLEYVPSAHLASAPTCMAWNNIQSLPSAFSRKNRKSGGGRGYETEILALGTPSGSVLLYSPKRNDVISTLNTKNEEAIVSLAWKSTDSILYAGGQHGHLFVFNTNKSSLSSSHAYTNQPITAIAQPPNESNQLLIASNVIALISLDTQSTLKTLTSHSGQIHILSILNNDLFLSASTQDNVLNVWSLSNASTSSSKPAFTLSVKENVFNVNSAQDEEKVLRIAVVTQSGTLKLFGKDLDSSPSKNKPLKPISVVHIAADKDKNGKVQPLPVLCSEFNDMNDIRIVYGNGTTPQFEVLKIEELEKETCLTRSVHSEEGLKATMENASGYTSNLQVPSVKSGVVVPSSGATKRKAQESSHVSTANNDSLTMMDRLKLLSKDFDPKTSPPRSDSLLQLLLQGLHNKDEKILSSVLDRTEINIIDNTVKKLPVEAIIPLIEELHKYLRGRGIVSQSHSNWLKSILLHHSSFLMSIPNCDQVLSSLITMLEERTRNYTSLIQLQGKLNLITKQMSKHSEVGSSSESVDREALLVYQHNSDDELPNALDELLLPASDTDDNWDESDDEEEKEESSEDDDEVELLNGDADDNEIEMDSD
ncbi:UTP5 [Lepeophtheirus salmonis]|uniref:UTP5 n=1 Tax=Lepeophtheirus salmonis TaxID=72036 RepID=A0A7R8CF07_LEPSM|nr:WD repeat-containing protein 43-like [Lepeophtheirus salmonis]CAB4056584.1 UTP5 [Lepeophtheirus salmonis]CAF2801564.1 UTP5 [Lepeophtheirus salmonis]